MGKKSKVDFFPPIILMVAALILTACARPPEYTRDSHRVLVVPNEGWQKPDVDHKYAQLARDQCSNQMEQDPEYVRIMRDFKNIRIVDRRYRSSVDQEIIDAPSIYAGKFIALCMKRQGFFYGKYKD
ncbi:hypothetical protein EO087_13855 [Dyella sp. M7H15-1]|uniref:hypothetical protein n=1 Tax=Dyella sp. M7H15-1 TaxID=2501295 RepID=UPI001005138D|nr:hypothetical protein [Dyella sp. M7H15-1]QAU24941.1 hypothetical protein EO087_13855 [Dyella sp. M7H15-1]